VGSPGAPLEGDVSPKGSIMKLPLLQRSAAVVPRETNM
jgi:hypothetical protein